MSDTEDKKDEKAEPLAVSFVEEWCKLYGLDMGTAEYLQNHGYTTGDDVINLYTDDIRRFTNLDDVRKCLLPGAVSRYRQGREVADKQIQQKGVIFTKKPKDEVKKKASHLEIIKTDFIDQPTAEQLSDKLDQMLSSLLMTGEADPGIEDPDRADVDLDESRRQTEEAVLKLENELFTEEELKLVAQVNKLREKYNNDESPEYERELAALIATM
ncbi:hypothetical protein LSH36_353g00041 [Paralvinella palmiformis]|uniref:Uncharacterized protein n=1 Tax=Paralvinella palmiformis TaxID=53620 RepID=A0AAD9JFK5_9ANNE|nr:hypothetical protein LSH36_353g00041 [Paralvinella palmiformis]